MLEKLLEPINQKLDTLTNNSVTKGDLQEAVKNEVKAAISPMELKVEQINNEVGILTTRMQKIEVSKTPAFSNNNDPARQCAAFVGFPGSMSAMARLQTMEEFMGNFPDFRAASYWNKYDGPNSDKKLSNIGFVQFADKDSAQAFIKAVKAANKSEFTIGDQKVRVKNALTRLQRSRDWALRTATELIKAKTSGKVETIRNGGERGVKVDGAFAFEQAQGEARGSFRAPFQNLILPA